MSKRRWTPADDAALRALHLDHHSDVEIATTLDRTMIAVRERRRLLGLAAKKMPDWTKEEEATLIDMLDRHETYAAIATALRRTEQAIIDRAVLLKVNASSANGRTIAATARLLGVDSKAVAWWANERWIRSHRTGLRYCRGDGRVIEHDDLLTFLEDERFWHLWEPARVTESYLAEWAQEIRHGVRFLTTGEAGDVLCLTHYRINQMIRAGQIRAVKHGPNWLIRTDWLIRPIEGTHRPGPRWTDAERAFVRDWWGKRTAVWIGERLNRSDGSVCHTAYKLGLPRLGRGYCKRKKAA